MTLLKTYLSENAIPQKGMAVRLGISRGYMSEIVNGDKTPGLELAFAIERETAGAVPASSWIEDAA
ncbi:helix-turn-helix transcriptional regulator [uncultured Maritimibacter sp.]|jgi:DNA-binding XRE family transcriptional regulator|uniref:helix-turn-helix domain-containing protein n=1 Tax=uncultured Maritimibacter sp. TaxID=991866 RepID=UPI002609693F|nr:helix-turn-helix transcriptional regulator [uncultured Maritimibacter sp.]